MKNKNNNIYDILSVSATTYYGSNLNLSTIPTNNNTLTEILGRNTTTGEIEYRDVSSIVGGQDNYVTGGTYSSGTLTLNRQNSSGNNATQITAIKLS